MPAKKSATTTTTRTRGATAVLPEVSSGITDVEWPGQSKTSANAAWKSQFETDLATMQYDSVVAYDVELTDKEFTAYCSLFRKVADKQHPTLGVRVVRQNGRVFFKLGDRAVRS